MPQIANWKSIVCSLAFLCLLCLGACETAPQREGTPRPDASIGSERNIAKDAGKEQVDDEETLIENVETSASEARSIERVIERRNIPPDNQKRGLARLPASLRQAQWIDVHTHCDAGEMVRCDTGFCCNVARWKPVASGGGGAVVASTEHYHLAPLLGYKLPAPLDQIDTSKINEIVATSAKSSGGLGFFISLDCWHNRKLEGDGKAWTKACKADVDRWIAKGAIGFKDHIGKQFNNAGPKDDYARWLGLWNRHNGFCQTSANDDQPAQTCMSQRGVRYPALEPAWREVVRYITEEKKLPILTHATSYYNASEPCWDPQINGVRSCAKASQQHALAFVTWAQKTLSLKARRRIILAHLGFLQNDGELLLKVMDTGISSETAIGIGTLAQRSCEIRQLFARYPKQMMFGTDINIDRECSRVNYQAWLHLWNGTYGEAKAFSVCFAKTPLEIKSSGLSQPKVSGCQYDVPKDMRNDLLKDNFLRLYED